MRSNQQPQKLRTSSWLNNFHRDSWLSNSSSTLWSRLCQSTRTSPTKESLWLPYINNQKYIKGMRSNLSTSKYFKLQSAGEQTTYRTLQKSASPACAANWLVLMGFLHKLQETCPKIKFAHPWELNMRSSNIFIKDEQKKDKLIWISWISTRLRVSASGSRSNTCMSAIFKWNSLRNNALHKRVNPNMKMLQCNYPSSCLLQGRCLSKHMSKHEAW